MGFCLGTVAAPHAHVCRGASAQTSSHKVRDRVTPQREFNLNKSSSSEAMRSSAMFTMTLLRRLHILIMFKEYSQTRYAELLDD